MILIKLFSPIIDRSGKLVAIRKRAYKAYTLLPDRRDKPGKEGKSFVSQENLAATISEMLTAIQASMLERATEFRDNHIHDPRDFSELSSVVQDGWALSWWCESKDCETKVKEETKASTRCMPVDQVPGEGKCIVCGQPAKRKVYLARSY